MAQHDIGDLRREYRERRLDDDDLLPDPLAMFTRWFDDAVAAEIVDANAMTVATVDARGQPSLRAVLLKYFDAEGFVFYTNYGSRKARELEGNPRVALHFLWKELERQVQIRGRVARVSAAESLRYFTRRPRESQIGAWVSQQSAPVSARGVLEAKFLEMKQKFEGGEVPLPSFWGGYRVVPEAIEIWQGRPHRLHDRFLYERDGDSWRAHRLAP